MKHHSSLNYIQYPKLTPQHHEIPNHINSLIDELFI